MKGINRTVFKESVGGKEANLAAIRPTLEDYGFTEKDENNAFELRDLTKTFLVAVEDRKVILHTGFGRRIREDALGEASCKLLELNAEHHLLLGVDVIDNEICCAYTFMVPARPLTKEAFEDVFVRYVQMMVFCEDLIAAQMRPYFVGILDENEDTESILHRILGCRSRLPGFDPSDVPFDNDDDPLDHILDLLDDDSDED